MAKLKAISIDIETRNLTEEQVEFESRFLKHHPSTKDKEKIALQLHKKRDALYEKGALTDSADIACIGFWSLDDSKPVVIHTLDYEAKIDGLVHYPCDSEKKMLAEFCCAVNDLCDENTHIIAANAGFDLPRIRYASSFKNKIGFPDILSYYSTNPIFDVLYIAGKYFMAGGGREYNLTLDELVARLGIESDGKPISGAEVPAMIDRGEHKEVIVYNAEDAVRAGKAYQYLTCQFD